MLGLTLREEFRGKRLKGPPLSCPTTRTPARPRSPHRKFLEITYPTHDLLKGIEAVGPNQGRPVS
jgi:hypothetical protein